MIIANPTIWSMLAAFSVRFWEGAVLFANGAIAMAEACCCTVAEDQCHPYACCCFHDDAQINVSWDFGGEPEPSFGESGPCPGPCSDLPYRNGSLTFTGEYLTEAARSADEEDKRAWTTDGTLAGVDAIADTPCIDGTPGTLYYALTFECRSEGPLIQLLMHRCIECTDPPPAQITECQYNIRVRELSTWVEDKACCLSEFAGGWEAIGGGRVIMGDWEVDEEAAGCNNRLCIQPEDNYQPEGASLTVNVTNNPCCNTAAGAPSNSGHCISSADTSSACGDNHRNDCPEE